MLTRCAAIGSFQVKSPVTYLVPVLVTVRVLPRRLTGVLIRSVILLVSTLGVRWYSAHRYSSMQVSSTRHSSASSTRRGGTGLMNSSPGSDVNSDTSFTRLSGADAA